MYILTHRSLSASARALVEQLKKLIDISVDVSYDPLNIPPTIRWGNSHGNYSTDTIFNSPKGIRMCGNKVAFSNVMSTLNTPFVELNSGKPDRYPVIVRTLLNASEGRGIVIAKNEDEFFPVKDFYWSYFYNFKYELGIHVLAGRVEKVFKKVWIGDGREPEIPIRNMSKGYSFKRVRPESFAKLHPFVQEFYKGFDLEFGRMDVGWDDDNKCYRLIEMNTAPSLTNNENTLELYANFLAERIV